MADDDADTLRPTRWRDLPGIMTCGLAMGCADAIPGVSGSTVALLLGIYERFIGHLARLMGLLRQPRSWPLALGSLGFLVPLGLGIVSALLVATWILVGHYEPPAEGSGAVLLAAVEADPPSGWLVNPGTAPLVFAFFFGLVAASVVVPLRAQARFRAWDVVLILLGATLVAGLGGGQLIDPQPGALMLMVAGALAIAVMLLPGISGSLALLVLGMYVPVAEAVNQRDVGRVLWVLLGMALGALAMVPLLRLALARWHDRLMALLAGLMLGSLLCLWPWKTHYLPKLIARDLPMSPCAPGSDWPWVLLCALAGAGLIVVMLRWRRGTT